MCVCCVFFLTIDRQRVTYPAMAQHSGMSHDEWTKLQELLGQAQQSGMVGEALVAMGLENGLAQQVGDEMENAQQAVIRPKAKLSSLEVVLVMDTLQQRTLDTHW